MRTGKAKALLLLLFPGGFFLFFYVRGHLTDLYDGERDLDTAPQQSRTYNNNKMANKTVVVLYTNQRSGSTFLGQTFNQNPNAFYLFEPLYPYTIKCRALKSERIEIFKDISMCNFHNIRNAYREAFKITQSRDYGCVDNGLCFDNLHTPLLRKYAQKCAPMSPKFNRNSATCGFPLRPDILEQICMGTDFMVFKILRLCSLKMIDEVYEELSNTGFNVYVIHLVRDPRAIFSSRLNVHLDGMNDEDLPQEAEHLCNRFNNNLDYVEEMYSGNSHLSNLVADGRYKRVRYEDIARDSLTKVEEIYRFLRRKLPSSVEEWIKKSQPNTENQIKRVEKVLKFNKMGKLFQDIKKAVSWTSFRQRDPFSTVQDPEEVLRKWKKSLTFDQVQIIQERCEEPMRKLNYTFVKSAEEMLDIRKSYY